MNEESGLKNKNVWWLSATSFFTDISSEMIFPILPIFLKSVLGAPIWIIGVIEGVAQGVAAFLQYFAGFLADKINNHKKLVLWGYGISFLAKGVFALANSAWMVSIFRISDRVGKGIRTAPRDALIANSVDASVRGRYFGLHRSLDTAGAILGTVIALLFLNFYDEGIATVLRAVLYWSLVPALIGWVLLLKVREVGDVESSRPVKLLAWGNLDKRFRDFLVLAFLFGLANYSYAFYILRASELGVAVFAVPLVYLVYNIFYGFSSYPAGIMSDKLGRKNILILALVFLAAVNFGFIYVANPSLVWVLFALYGLVIGMTDGVMKAFVSDLVIENRALSFGWFNIILGVATIFGNVIGGVLWQRYGAFYAFGLSGFLGLIAVVYLFYKNSLALKGGDGKIKFQAYR